MKIETYLEGVVPSEIGNAHIEACKAQAIASRTVAWPYLIDGEIEDPKSIPQAYRPDRANDSAYANAHRAVEETEGMMLYYDGKVISPASFSASNGGKTTSSEERWGGYRPWLIEQKDPWDFAATGGKKRGHGVGMSQEGAKYAAEMGKSCEEILRFYYPGCVIVSKENGDEMTSVKKAKEKALSLIGQGYIYGAKGQICSRKFREQQAAQYPEWEDNILNVGAKWDGKPVWDCAQFTRVVAKEAGVTLVSGATSQWDKTDWDEKGTIDTIPPDELVFVYRRQNGSSTVMAHTGVALGDGTCVHARGTAYGVVQQNMAQHAWTHWARPKWPSAPENNNIKEDSETEGIGVAKVVGGTQNMRASASTSASRILGIPAGAEVEVKEKGEEWCKVSYKNNTGFVMTKYLDFGEETIDENNFDVVIHCSTASEREVLLTLLHGAKSK